MSATDRDTDRLTLGLSLNKGLNRDRIERLAVRAWERGDYELAAQLAQAAALYAIAIEIGRAGNA